MMIVTDCGRVNDINKHLKISTIYKSSFEREELWKFYKKKRKKTCHKYKKFFKVSNVYILQRKMENAS